MKKLIEYALNHFYTFIVIPILVIICGIIVIFRMQTDIFPKIETPAISIVWTYNGISAEDIEKRVITIAERNYTSTVSNIEHTESQCLYGVGIIKIFLQQGADLNTAITQVNAASQTVLRVLPPRSTPPEVLKYTPSTIPVVQLILSSKSLPMTTITDIAQNHLKSQLAIVKGAQVPMPQGGKTKQIIIDLNPQDLETFGLSATDVVNAIVEQNVILPAGSVKINKNDYYILMNNSPKDYQEINAFPIKTRNGVTTYIRDVGFVHEGFATPTNIVRNNDKPASVISVFKTEEASTLEVKGSMDKKLPRILETIPKEINVKQIFDQSVFVKTSIRDVIFSAFLAILLTSCMILLFLGSLNSTFIIALSIPLSILFSIIILYLLGHSLNMMTLGGLSLAIGMLVDDSTVVIENIHRNFKNNLDIKSIILNSASEVATPQFFSTISICCVFFPVFLMSGVSKSLFVPMATAVIFAMLASYFFANTLIPCLAEKILPLKTKKTKFNAYIEKLHLKSNELFEELKNNYKKVLDYALENKIKFVKYYFVVILFAMLLVPFVGSNFFPSVDTGEIRLHVYVKAGTRIEETAKKFSEIENTIREVIPEKEIQTILDKIGLPVGGINLAFMDNSSIGVSDGEISIALAKHHKKTSSYEKKLRKVLNEKYPDTTFFFQRADMTGKILDFGLSSPIDIKISGKNLDYNYQLATSILEDVKKIAGVKDAHIHQSTNVPVLSFNVDRAKASQMGYSQDNIARDILTSLDSSTQTTPSYWVNTKTGVNYTLALRVPPYRFTNFQDVMNIPIGNVNNAPVKFGNVANISNTRTVNVVNHYNILPTYDIFLNIEDNDLGSVYKSVRHLIKKYDKNLERGTFIDIYGQAKTMNETFASLIFGLFLSFAIVYLIAVINFQSFKNALLVLISAPFAICGGIFMLFITDTPFSTPALMGTLMAVGVSCANSTLLGSFLISDYKETKDLYKSIILASTTRIRPILMTSTAMILGLLPMALGFGEGGEQNAPLGRTVIGGLMLATLSTLVVIPIVFNLMNEDKKHEKNN